RELLKKILVDFVAEQKATVLIASHNLRELEDLCDHVGLLHRGGVIFERELDDLKLGLYRIQAAFQSGQDFEELKQKLTITKVTTRGRMIEFTAKGDKDEIYEMVNAKQPLICEVLPLTLEEVFISEMEVAGYDINNLIQ
ncbi:MAG: ABC transporter ATP-binding protein, partial [Clostridiales bacterium]|nr:ABC transporter ATP-binding protein [Clostridiales bacterium]